MTNEALIGLARKGLLTEADGILMDKFEEYLEGEEILDLFHEGLWEIHAKLNDSLPKHLAKKELRELFDRTMEPIIDWLRIDVYTVDLWQATKEYYDPNTALKVLLDKMPTEEYEEMFKSMRDSLDEFIAGEADFDHAWDTLMYGLKAAFDKYPTK